MPSGRSAREMCRTGAARSVMRPSSPSEGLSSRLAWSSDRPRWLHPMTGRRSPPPSFFQARCRHPCGLRGALQSLLRKQLPQVGCLFQKSVIKPPPRRRRTLTSALQDHISRCSVISVTAADSATAPTTSFNISSRLSHLDVIPGLHECMRRANRAGCKQSRFAGRSFQEIHT